MNIPSVDLKKLQTFYFCAKYGSLTKAAQRLNLTVPAVSVQIRRLEKDLGVELFERLSNKLLLTKAAEGFVAEVEGIFDRIDKALGVLSTANAPTGRLKVSIGADMALYFTPRISNFMKRYPAIELSLLIRKADETVRLIADGSVDVGFHAFGKIPKALNMEPIVTSTLSLACVPNHPLLRRKNPTLEEMARFKLLVPPSQSHTRRVIDQTFANARIKPRSFIEAGNCQTARAFAERDIGVAVIHTLCAGQGPSMGLHLIDLEAIFGHITVSAAHRKGLAPSTALARLIEEMSLPHHTSAH
jgi:DNA-binding transcriptional LysR family regulator